MSVLKVLLVIVACTHLMCESRRYIEAENHPYRIKSLYSYNYKGEVVVEDLTNVKLRGRSVPIDDLALYLYTKQNLLSGYKINMSKIETLKNAKWYNSKKENYFIVHGWRNFYKSEMNTLIVPAVLKTNDFNVFVLDWSKVANGLYSSSFRSVNSIGLHLATFINKMVEEFKINTRMFMLVGHSLGAHIVGCAGAGVNGSVRYIVGFDPAGPLFSLNNINNRLDVSDADFVQVIHTTAILGFSSSIGHADYYPNNGKNPQPGCGLDPLCAHGRSFVFYAESVISHGFISLNCSSYRMYKKGKCYNQHVSYLGRIEIDTRAHGDYYLETNSRSPYGISLVKG